MYIHKVNVRFSVDVGKISAYIKVMWYVLTLVISLLSYCAEWLFASVIAQELVAIVKVKTRFVVFPKHYAKVSV